MITPADIKYMRSPAYDKQKEFERKEQLLTDAIAYIDAQLSHEFLANSERRHSSIDIKKYVECRDELIRLYSKAGWKVVACEVNDWDKRWGDDIKPGLKFTLN